MTVERGTLMSTETPHSGKPLASLEQWDEFLEGRYQEGKSETEFRQYDAQANPGVAEF
jgi:inositol oxygenase